MHVLNVDVLSPCPQFGGHVGPEQCLLPSLALNFAVMYSSPGNLALFLLADALGQPDRLRRAADQDQGPEGSHTTPLSTAQYKNS